MKNRIYGEKVEIDVSKVRNMYEKRFTKENPLASVMLRCDINDGIAEKRNQNELELLTSLVDFSTQKSILDIGCGLGRWASNLKNSIYRYDGIDYSSNYINVAKTLFVDDKRINFYNMDISDFSKERFNNEYNLIIVNGLCYGANDKVIEKLFHTINNFITNDNYFYLRESVSVIGERLTLKDFYSDELKTEYNAIYRTPDEYEDIVRRQLLDVEIVATGFLLTEETGSRKETNQKYWLLKKK